MPAPHAQPARRPPSSQPYRPSTHPPPTHPHHPLALPLPAQEPVWRPEGYAPEAEPAARGTADLDAADASELEAAEDDFGDDQFLEAYRRKRLAELAAGPAAPRYGGVEELRRSEFVAEVTNAGEGVWVVVHLYTDR